MTDTSIVRPVATTLAPTEGTRSYVDWAAVLGGTFLATAVFVTLTTFGSAIGLSLTSPYSGQGFSAKATAIAIAIWSVWVAVSSLIAGGYLAGRLRHRVHDASEHESDIRDGSHGLLVWALAALFSSYLIATAAGGLASHAPGHAAAAPDPATSAADTLLRGDRAPAAAYDDGLHREVARVLATGAYGSNLTTDNRTYLARVVAARSGANQADAERRVDAAVIEVRNETNTARRIGVLVAFLTAASLAVGAAGAWWAAVEGGKHRDQGTAYSPFTRWD